MKPTPPGWPRMSASVYYDDPHAAIEFLRRAFGFEVRLMVEGDDGTIHHSELCFAEALIMVGGTKGREPWQEMQRSPRSVGGAVTHALALHLDDVDAHYARALEAGAKIVREPADERLRPGLLVGSLVRRARSRRPLVVVHAAHTDRPNRELSLEAFLRDVRAAARHHESVDELRTEGHCRLRSCRGWRQILRFFRLSWLSAASASSPTKLRISPGSSRASRCLRRSRVPCPSGGWSTAQVVSVRARHCVFVRRRTPTRQLAQARMASRCGHSESSDPSRIPTSLRPPQSL